VGESLARRYDAVRPHLTERQCRVWLVLHLPLRGE
jgi:hypothetical protein